MNKLGAYMYLFVMCAPGLYVFVQLVKDEFTYIKHRIQRLHNKD
jgi:hypothetical protein